MIFQAVSFEFLVDQTRIAVQKYSCLFVCLKYENDSVPVPGGYV
jgi:hypothetical protein